MSERHGARKLSLLVSFLLVIQLMLPAVNVFAAETANSSILPPSNVSYQVTGADIKLTWNTVFGATGYQIYEITEGQLLVRGTTATNSYTMKSVSEGSYTYAISTLSAEGESGPSAPVTADVVYPEMTAPALTASVQNGSDLVLNWTASANAQSYNLFQIQEDGQTALVKTQTSRTFSVINVAEGTYRYAVSAANPLFGESPLSAPAEVTVVYPVMAAPGSPSFTVTNVNDLTLKWAASSYASSYRIYQINDGGKALKTTVTGTSAVFANQAAGQYVYEVHAYSDRFGESAEGSQITATIGSVTMTAPTNFAAKLQNVNDVLLTWTASANATNYKIYQIVDGQAVLKSTVTGTSVAYTNQPAGDYLYEVRAYSDRFGESAQGSQASLTIGAVALAPPSGLAYKLLNMNDVILTWTASANADGYKVYQVVDGQKVLKSTVSSTSATYTLQPAGNYEYVVHAYSSRFGESAEGSSVTFTIDPVILKAPGNVKYAIVNGNDATLSWDASEYADSYKVYLVANGQKTLKSTVATKSVTYSYLPKGDYTYEVYAASSRFGTSAEAGTVSFTLTWPVMQAPANAVQTITNATSFTLSWDAVPYATSYKVYQVVNGQKVLRTTASKLNVTYTGMAPGSYTYMIHSVSDRFGDSVEGSTVNLTLNGQVMEAPTNPVYTVANGNDVTLKWTAAEYATSYRVYQIVDGQKTLKSNVGGTSVTYYNQPEGSLAYEIHSVSSLLGESPEGADVSFQLTYPDMTAPGNPAYKILNGNDVRLTWTAAAYGDYYKVYELIDGAKVAKSSVTTYSSTLSNVSSGPHAYIVHAVSYRFGESPEGSKLTLNVEFPIMETPTGFTQTVSSGNDVTLKWNYVNYATAYKLYQVVNGEEVLVKTQSGTTVTLLNQPEGDYKYVLRSYSDRFGDSPEGAKLEFPLVWPTMQPPATLTSTIANGNDMTLKWGAATYATAYRVYQVVDGQKVLKSTVTSTSATLENLPEGNYEFAVYAYSSRFGESPAGKTLNVNLVWPTVVPPVVKGTVFDANNITLSWPAVTWVSEYRVYDVTDGKRQLLYKGTALSYKIYNLTEATHQYEVTAYHTRFGESVASNRISENIVFPVMQPPVATLKLLSTTSARITWNFVTYANGYNVYELIDGQSVLVAEKVNNLSYTLTDLTYKNHEYYVTSVSNSFGQSAPSNIVLAKLIVDTEAPVTTAAALTTWTNGDQNVSLSATDNETGVAATYYAVNGGVYTAGNSLTVDQEGITEISFYSVDRAGNKETAKTIQIKIDRTAPATIATAPTAWVQAAAVKLAASDAQSGVAATYYAVNGSEYQEGTSFTVENEGVSTISFYSVDAAGNKEDVQTIKVSVDRTAPVTTATAPTAWVQAAAVELAASDAQSGVAATYYAVNGSEYQEGTSFTVENEGVSTISFYSVDAAGNKEEAQTIKVSVDRTAPVTTATAPTAWVQAAAVKLAASDAQSGVAATYYAVNGSEYQEGTSFTVENEGVSTISFYSVDAAGNKEDVQTIKVSVDRTAPVTTATAPTAWVQAAAVKLAASDAQSGVAATYYAVNGSEYQEGTSFTVENEGVSTISFYSVDAAGNKEDVQTIKVSVDRTAPLTTAAVPGGWSKDDVTVTLTAADAQSGIARTLYSIDGSANAEGSKFTIGSEGIHQVTFYSVDATGNIEAAQTAIVKIDKSAPVITMNVKDEYVANTNLTLNYSVVDTLSSIVSEKMTVTRPDGTATDVRNGSAIALGQPGVYAVLVTATNGAGMTTTVKKQIVVAIQGTITVTPTVIKGNKGVFTVRVDLPNGYSTQGFDLNSVTLNGVKALNSNNGYYNQASIGQFKFERSDFNWTTDQVTLSFRGYVDGKLVVGQTTVKVQK
ncbi:OmpL47-type beta-barrel domain-containing protein [Paenibacillus aurantiacus]|uniref:OmpL47-type beta-barrel domain-containing protein n=1 Tax=Paenibacillus aurantiacus TaxID=1936118 RepID=A0ABV5KP42_9BACL